MIVLDTSVLSAALRRTGRSTATGELLRTLVREDIPLAVPGIVLQELLSGVRTSEQFERLRKLMTGFPTLAADRENHVFAARISNACRKAGVSAATVDCLIAAQTLAAGGELATLDEDFRRMARNTGLRLLSLPAS